MAVNTKKVGYSVQDVCQILHYSTATVHRLINDKVIECLITDAKTPGGRRQFRFLKEHIQHYMLKHYDRFDDTTLQTWGVMTTPKKFVANASTPRIPIDAFSKPLEGTPTRPARPNPNMDRCTPEEWASKPTKKPYLRTPEVKAAEKTSNVEKREPSVGRYQKQFPTFKIEVDMHAGEMVVPNEVTVSGIEGQTAADIAKALLNDRNLRIKELRIKFDGLYSKEDDR